MNAIKYQKLSEKEMSKLVGGAKKWVHVDTVVLESRCEQRDENGNCIVIWVATRQTWQRVNSQGDILKTEYRPD